MGIYKHGITPSSVKAEKALNELRPLCEKCGWAKGGLDSWNGHACKCGEYAPPIQLVEDEKS